MLAHCPIFICLESVSPCNTNLCPIVPYMCTWTWYNTCKLILPEISQDSKIIFLYSRNRITYKFDFSALQIFKSIEIVKYSSIKTY